jgi:uncharacterized protein (DUF1501 family)
MSVMIAGRDGLYRTADGSSYRIEAGRTTADPGHPMVREFPDAWNAFAVHLTSDDETAPAADDTDSVTDLREQVAELEEVNEELRATLNELADAFAEAGVPVVEPESGGWLVRTLRSVLPPRAVEPIANVVVAGPADPSTPDGRMTIRAWAVGRGLDVAQRGALSAAVVRAYEEAHA